MAKKRGTKKKQAEPGRLARWFKRDEEAEPNPRMRLVVVLVVLGVTLAGSAVGLSYLEKYVQDVARERGVLIKSIKPKYELPPWVSEELKTEVFLSTGIRQEDFILDEELPTIWADRLAQNPWVKEVHEVHRQVHLVYDEELRRVLHRGKVVVDCTFRRPVALVEQGAKRYYLDEEGTVLPYMALSGAGQHVIKLTGEVAALPRPGNMVNSQALLAGLEVLTLIRRVDEAFPEQEQLWGELCSLDVSNYEGRTDLSAPHLTLYTANDTEVRWGAAVGRSRPYHEASEKEKLTTLYRTHRQTGSLDSYRFVELRDTAKPFADPLRYGHSY